MNYLKKKIKTVVHGNKPKDDDDDDYDNYVPEIPPHPSTLAENGPNPTNNANNNLTNFANFDSLSSFTSDSAALAAAAASAASSFSVDPLQKAAEEPKPKLSLEELKELEEEERKKERERLRKSEEEKKDCEEWKFFLNLTAKVDAVTNKTQTSLTKLQEESAINQISVIEDPLYSDRYDDLAAKTAGAWAAFEDNSGHNPADPIFTLIPTEQQQQQPPQAETAAKIPEVVDEDTKRIARELIEDFGFTNPAAGIGSMLDDLDRRPREDISTVDPFDTSYIDIEAIKSGDILTRSTLIKDISVEEADPFDTSHIESSIQQDLIIED